MKPGRYLTIKLAPRWAEPLLAHCDATGDEPGNVVADLVTLFLDELAGEADLPHLTDEDIAAGLFDNQLTAVQGEMGLPL